MTRPAPSRFDRDRVVSALGVALIHAALGWALLTGLGVSVPSVVEEQLALFDVTLPQPTPVVPPPDRAQRAPERSGRASPPNLKSVATPIVAPPPVIPFPPPPIVAAPVARDGDDPTAGAAPVAGPGYGAGGEGDGTGSGGYGDGAGGGGRGGTPLRLLKGRLSDDDYPEAALAVRASGTVSLRFVVGVDGRARDCRVTRSSGNAALDETTCRLIQQRLRYRPSRDARGRPYPDIVTGTQEWNFLEFMERRDRADD
ncbi:MAG: energy transducer TonB [Pseudomonadota bacterium]